MTVRVGINGFGRIGRNFLRVVLGTGADIEIVALNDITDAATNAHLLRYDSTYGKLGGVSAEEDAIVVQGRRISVLSEREPSKLPWKDLGADVVVESTGRFTKRGAAAAHLDAGARRVLISAPAGDADATFVMGVNDSEFDPERHFVVSNGSCTTNCFVPMVKVVDDAFGIVGGLMTTVHGYTNDQNLLDLPHRDLRRARAAAVNIVPTTTGAARATSLVLQSMKGKLDGEALRVPVVDGSITDFTAVVPRAVTVDDVNRAFEDASGSGPLSKVLDYTDEPIVSTDIIGRAASVTFDSKLTMVMPVSDSSTMVKVHGWYDNEWGYSNRLVDMVVLLGSVG
jgi:glyceraldehyde 3-phosphate dehydrogenase